MSILKAKAFGFEELKRKVERQARERADDQELKRWLSYIGEHLCSHARREGGYTDRTGNLRSSIGYRIFKDGEVVVDGGFENVGDGDGIEDAKEALNAYGLAHEIPVNGWTLVVVAGKSYARYVEAKGYNVLHLTKIEMDAKIEELKKELGLN